MYGLTYIRASAPKPPKYSMGMDILSTSPQRRLDLILWYTSGFQ
jgi:hypothetical protein